MKDDIYRDVSIVTVVVNASHAETTEVPGYGGAIAWQRGGIVYWNGASRGRRNRNSTSRQRGRGTCRAGLHSCDDVSTKAAAPRRCRRGAVPSGAARSRLGGDDLQRVDSPGCAVKTAQGCFRSGHSGNREAGGLHTSHESGSSKSICLRRERTARMLVERVRKVARRTLPSSQAVENIL